MKQSLLSGKWGRMMVLGMIVLIVLMVVLIWALVYWLNNRQALSVPYTRQSQDTYQSYEQGYQLQRQPTPGSQVAEWEYQYRQPEYEQPQAQYPQEMPLQRSEHAC